MPRPVKLSVVRDERKASDAKEFRRQMYARIRQIVDGTGDEISGYALVVWDKDGYNGSALKPGGPVKSRLIPTFVGDALTQHVAVELAKDDV